MPPTIKSISCKRLLYRWQIRLNHNNVAPPKVVPVKRAERRLFNEERKSKLWETPRQVTFKAGGSSGMPQSEVLKWLKDNFRMRQKFWDKLEVSSQRDQALVILGTPGYANWLEDTHFISELLKTLTRHRGSLSDLPASDSASEPDIPPFEVDVVCACVDGLAPHIDSLHKTPTVDEGLSFLQGRTQQILPGLWEPETTNIQDSPGMLSSLTFSADKNSSQVTLPLANTLFRNGRGSTLLISKWRCQPDGEFVRVRNEEKSNQLINAFKRTGTGMPSHSIPVVPLTPARRIASGLGNIVRQIQFDEDIGPASRELEVNIDDYQKRTGLPASTVNVWALVIPPELLPDSSTEGPNGLVLDPDSIKRLWASPSLLDMNTVVGSWIERGAKVCRVLSGGGGWGAKQGLLSLDPQTSYTTVKEARFDFSGGSLEEQQASVLGNIASPDAFIQFFLANDLKRSLTLIPKTPFSMFQKGTVVGAVPSTIDSIPGSVKSYGRRSKRSIFFHPGHFGAVSESGIYYNSPAIENTKHGKFRKSTHTKIDVPYSYIFTDFQKKEKSEELD